MGLPKILILSPFRNEAHAIRLYMKGLENLDYPRELIDLYWLENDSSDDTLELLKALVESIDFKSVRLESIEILGPVEKRPPGGYWKDMDQRNRKGGWVRIWNERFLSLIRGSNADYVLAGWSEAVPPSNVIHEYLKVFEEYKDAGWVGGSMYRRRPCGTLNPVLSPWRTGSVLSEKPVKVLMTGHVWMMPREAVSKCSFYLAGGGDVHFSLIKDLEKQGLYVYYQPSVFIKHISSDGKIYDEVPGW